MKLGKREMEEDDVAPRKLREREAEGAAGGAEGENNAGEGGGL